tara:strand:+ start:123599 stop:124261 length:663 start_codon:yes stop_codon:yes gene_type:complete
LATETLLTGAALAPAVLSAVAVIALVACDQTAFRAGRYLFKPLAAAAFVWLAWAMGATESPYGCWLLAGLMACMAGDLLLMPEGENTFLAGLVAFLCGHLLFAIAFLQLPLNFSGLAATAIPAVILLVFANTWLLPCVAKDMTLPVRAYMLVITAMLLCAGMTVGQPVSTLIILGAWGFAISDLAVARQQFVQPSRWNGLWGTPLYFLSQMILAVSISQI